MRILQINSVCGSGSTGRLAVQISDYLNQCNIDNYIAYGFGSSDRPNTFHFGNRLDAHMHSFLSRKLGWQGKASHITTYRLIRYIERINPDIVHLHNIHGHYLNYNMLFRFLKKKGCEVVWTFHDCWPMTGKCAHFTEAKCEKWKTGCYDCPQLDRYPDSERDHSQKSYQEKKTAFTSIEKLHIVTVSNWLKSVAEASFLGKKDIRRISNGVDTELFAYRDSTIREQYHLQSKLVILGVASVWNNRKGLNQFLALSEDLKDDAVIVLIGVTADQQKNFPENVIGVPAIHDQITLAQWYSAADVYINFSIEETFGLTVAEAMACGTPAIVMNRTACPEVVDLASGFVAEAGDIKYVEKAMEIIKRHGREYFSAKCRKRIEKLFSVEMMQREYLNMYLSLGVRND